MGEDVEESKNSIRASQQAQNEMKEYDKLRRTFLLTYDLSPDYVCIAYDHSN